MGSEGHGGAGPDITDAGAPKLSDAHSNATKRHAVEELKRPRYVQQPLSEEPILRFLRKTGLELSQQAARHIPSCGGSDEFPVELG